MNIEQQNKILWGIACVALFAVVVLGITVVYNEGVEKKELVDKVEFLEHELAQKNLEYEWLAEITEYKIDDYVAVQEELDRYKQAFKTATHIYDLNVPDWPEDRYPITSALNESKSEPIKDQIFEVSLIKSFEDNELVIHGTTEKSFEKVKGAIFFGGIDDLQIVYAFSNQADSTGNYNIVIDTSNSSHWKNGEYTISIQSGDEIKTFSFSF